jgi:hypothetical protein
MRTQFRVNCEFPSSQKLAEECAECPSWRLRDRSGRLPINASQRLPEPPRIDGNAPNGFQCNGHSTQGHTTDCNSSDHAQQSEGNTADAQQATGQTANGNSAGGQTADRYRPGCNISNCHNAFCMAAQLTRFQIGAECNVEKRETENLTPRLPANGVSLNSRYEFLIQFFYVLGGSAGCHGVDLSLLFSIDSFGATRVAVEA